MFAIFLKGNDTKERCDKIYQVLQTAGLSTS